MMPLLMRGDREACLPGQLCPNESGVANMAAPREAISLFQRGNEEVRLFISF